MINLKPERLKKAFDYVDEHFDEMLKDLETVCSYPSTASNPQGREDTRRCIISKMKSIGIEPVIHDIDG